MPPKPNENFDYEKMTVVQLKALLKEKGRTVSGKKAELVERLKNPTVKDETVKDAKVHKPKTKSKVAKKKCKSKDEDCLCTRKKSELVKLAVEKTGIEEVKAKKYTKIELCKKINKNIEVEFNKDASKSGKNTSNTCLIFNKATKISPKKSKKKSKGQKEQLINLDTVKDVNKCLEMISKENDLFDNFYKIKRLKEHLLLLKINHEDEIVKQKTIKDAHIYCVINNISAQQYRPILEKFIILKHGYKKNKSSHCVGDCSKESQNIEIKVSLGGNDHKKFNYVQIRLSQDIGMYIFTAYYLTNENVDMEGELFIFKIPKQDMIDIIISNGSYAHGTKRELGSITRETISEYKNREYAIRPSFNDKCWLNLMKFRIKENEL